MDVDVQRETTENAWLKLTITTTVELVDAISDFMVGVIHAGVEVGVEDFVEKRILNSYLEKKNLDESEIQETVSKVGSHLAELADIFQVECPELQVTTIYEEDWGNNWKAHFTPFAVVPGLIIAPTWEEYSPSTDEQVIKMDPGMAFGTGHHATTSMSISLIQKALKDKQRATVLDVGTGTGVLGMAALIYGAEKVLGVDNDIEAVLAGRDNVALNDFSEKMIVSQEDVADINGEYTLVVANIIHDVLQLLRQDLIKNIATGGELVLSGLLAGEQVESIILTFTEGNILVLEEQLCKGEWAALRFKKT